MDPLSPKQSLVFDFINECVRLKGYPPSVREIGNAVGFKSTSTVHSCLDKLEQFGYIRRDPTKPRAIEILFHSAGAEPAFSHREYVDVPIIGTITAGVPILAVENREDTFPIPIDYVHNDDVFMLRVKGESMIEAGIFDRDLILVKQQNSAQNGDIIVALIEDYATVKRFFKEKDYIRLQPENSAMSPIIVKDVTILGKVTGLFRKF